MQKPPTIATLVVLLLAAAPAGAHDFWIEPSTFEPAVGSMVEVRLRVGERFRGQPVLRSAAKIERFVVAGPEGELPVLGRDGSDPAGLLRIARPGCHAIAYRSTPSFIELDAPAFESYLREEGLQSVIDARKKSGRQDEPGRESYARCAKALLRTAGAASAGYDRAVGLTLELIPEKDPFTVAGGKVAFTLLFEGRPCAGVRVVALNRDRPESPLSARSDEEGRVAFELGDGAWLIKCVHMVPAISPGPPDWLSYWASLTFERD